MRVAAALLAVTLGACAAVPAPRPATADAAAQTAAPAHLDAARETIRSVMGVDGIPGMAVAVYRGDTLIWSEAFGLANVELSAPVSRETLFRIGSVSKLFAGTIAARLADRGEIDLDRPVHELVPEWPQDKPAITMRQLLGHLSGIRHYGPEVLDPFDGTPTVDFALYPDHASILALFADDALLSEPGAEYRYSSYGFSLAQVALEAATGKAYLQLLQDEVLGPGEISGVRGDSFLGVVPSRTSFYDKPGTIIAGPALHGETILVSLPLNSAYKIAGGGLLASAEGLARYGLLHMGPGQFLSGNAHALLMTRQRDRSGAEAPAGLAWSGRADAFGRHTLGHAGSQQGSRASLALYPEQGYVVALTSNLGGYPLDIHTLGGALVDIFEGGSGEPPLAEER